MKPVPAMANWCLNATNCVKFTVNAGGHPAFVFTDGACPDPDDDRRRDRVDDLHGDHFDDHYTNYDAALRVGASDCLAIHNFDTTSHGHASNRHPSSNHGGHDRQSVISLMVLALFPQPALP